MRPQTYTSPAIGFAQRGFASVIVMRRGYGHSTGIFWKLSGRATTGTMSGRDRPQPLMCSRRWRICGKKVGSIRRVLSWWAIPWVVSRFWQRSPAMPLTAS